jgi:hypothetical protein
MKKLLKVPNDYEVAAATPLGYPSDANAFSESENRKNMNEIAPTNKF